jgi:predicted hotdog family 3-hydroxylacyl-ACP dehydratase
MTTAPDREWLLANLPHQGRMSLLRKIVSWDATTLHALADGHRDGDHPLRRAGELPIAAGIEYGAQAAAAHGALNAGTPSPAGLVASVRGVSFHARRLDDVRGDLAVTVTQLGESDAGVLYRFEVGAQGRMLVEGRLAVAFTR